MTDDRVTTAERYASATHSGNLTPSMLRTTDADVLLAAGIAASGDPKLMLALSIYRLGVTGDQAGLYTVVEGCDRWLAGYQARGGRRPMHKQVRHAVIVATLKHFMNPTCSYCGGTGVIADEGTAGRLTNPCNACHGSGKRGLRDDVPRAYVDVAHWLSQQIDQHCATIHERMARLLSNRLNI